MPGNQLNMRTPAHVQLAKHLDWANSALSAVVGMYIWPVVVTPQVRGCKKPLMSLENYHPKNSR